LNNEVIDFIKNNEISTSEVGDALGKIGGVPGVVPLNLGHYVVGEIFYTCGYADSNWMIHNDIINTPKDSIVFIENLDNTDKALIGEIVTRFILEKKKAKAIVTTGKIRDSLELRKLKIPIWHIGTNPIGCFNSKPVFTDDLEDLALNQKNDLKKAILVCDDDGVVIINKEQINNSLIEKLKKLKEQEIKWKECVFEKGWDTFETICMKRYL